MDPREASDPRETIAGWLRIQSRWCERLGSPLYARLLIEAGEDAAAGGPRASVVWEALRGHEADPPGSALALRFMGSMHRLVLTGAAPALTRYYPSVGGSDGGDPWPAFRDAVADNLAWMRSTVERPVQTNEVGRSAVLLGGFLTIARETGLPLRVLEIGSSAGLNLHWDRFRYESGAWSWGDPLSSVRFTGVFQGATPDAEPVDVVERAGCDAAPVDPTSDDGRVTLLSYVWADQVRRFELLRAALDVAGRFGGSVTKADGPSWLAGWLEVAAPNVATVVFHSIVAQYLGESGRSRLHGVMAEAASRATASAPLAWLRFEPSHPDGGGKFLVLLTSWPGGGERVLAEAHPHGPPVRWRG